MTGVSKDAITRVRATDGGKRSAFCVVLREAERGEVKGILPLKDMERRAIMQALEGPWSGFGD